MVQGALGYFIRRETVRDSRPIAGYDAADHGRAILPHIICSANRLAGHCAPLTPNARGAKPTDSKIVLFVCEHGVAKSVLAAALFKTMARERGLAVRADRRAASTPQIEPSLSTNKAMAADGVFAFRAER